MASIVYQKTLMKRETTPGTANVTAMNQFTALSVRPSFVVERNNFRAQGYKLFTTSQRTAESGGGTAEGIQDYNHLGFIAASRIAMPVTTTPGGGTLSRQHVFTLAPAAEDTKATYTTHFGDTNRALQTTYGVFNSLGINIQRNSLSLDTSFLSRMPTVISSIATAGVVTVPSQPTAGSQFSVYADSTWAGLGTTQLLAAYEGAVTLGDKFGQDTPINASIVGFGSLVEAQDQDYSGSLTLGFDATAEGLITTFTNDAYKFVRFQAIGPLIETTITYKLLIDMCIKIQNPGEVGTYGEGTYVLPFDYILVPDPTTGNALTITLVNTITAY